MPETTTESEKQHRKWMRELDASKKREKEWKTEAEKIVDRYNGEERKKNRYNVLWTNTRILRPAIFNSRPNPDVRRRFRDADPLGKAISEVLERSLSIFVDHDETMASLKNDVLDSLLVGRGVSRIRYEPKITQVPKDDGGDVDTIGGSEPAEPDDEPEEQLDGEQVICEHVDWRDYREGYGRTWAEVPWVSYRHKLTKADAAEKFEKAIVDKIEFSVPTSDDPKKRDDEMHSETAKTAEFWEMWDKVGRKVFFLHEETRELIYPKDNPDGAPPFKLDSFFPGPDPCNVMDQTGSRVPIPMFRMYREQADELDKITGRIDKILNGMRVRGIYDSALPEIADLLSSEDNELVPVQGAKQWGKTGLDGAISWMPLDNATKALEVLQSAREEQLKIIDQILGISDIVRGATDPNETLGAQEMKGGYFSVRLGDMKDAVQRYARDILRIAAAVMGQKFEQQTFATMTDMQFPSAEDKQRIQMQLQQQAIMAQHQAAAGPPVMGGPPPNQPPVGPAPPGAPSQPPHPPMPPPGPNPQQQAILQMPTWEDIIGAMRSDRLRQFKVDVETDSTVQGLLSSDMAGMSQVLKAVTEAATELAPLITSGALPVDAAKEIIMAVIRRARLGLAVEDAFDKMQAPKPPPNKEQIKAQADQQNTQMKAQADAHLAQLKAQSDEQAAQVKAQTDIHVAQIKAQLDAQVAQAQQQAQAAQNRQEQMLEQQRQVQENAQAQWEAKLDAAVKIAVAQIAAKNAVDVAETQAAASTVETDL